jgi:hypothetical protein
MKTTHAILICLIVLVIFNYTAVALKPSIQQNINLTLKEKPPLQNLLNVSPKENSGPITLGDPIEDPIPDNQEH